MILSLAVVSTPQTYAQEASAQDLTESLVRKLRSYEKFSDVVAAAKKKSPEAGLELEKFYRAKNLLNEKLPQLLVTAGAVSIPGAGKVRVLAQGEKKLLVSWGEKKVEISSDLPFVDQLKAIESLVPQGQLSFMDLLIPTAHAEPSVILFLAVVTALGALWILGMAVQAGEAVVNDVRQGLNSSEIEEINGRLSALESACNNRSTLGAEQIVEAYNRLAELKESRCSDPVFREQCGRLDRLLSCLQVRARSHQRGVNDSDRSSGKEIQFNTGRNRYSISRPASPQ